MLCSQAFNEMLQLLVELKRHYVVSDSLEDYLQDVNVAVVKQNTQELAKESLKLEEGGSTISHLDKYMLVRSDSNNWILLWYGMMKSGKPELNHLLRSLGRLLHKVGQLAAERAHPHFCGGRQVDVLWRTDTLQVNIASALLGPKAP